MTRCVFVIGLVENKRAILKRKHCSTLKCTTSVSIKNNGLYCTLGLINKNQSWLNEQNWQMSNQDNSQHHKNCLEST